MKDDGKYKPVYIYVDDLLVDVLTLGCSPSLIRVCFPFARYWVTGLSKCENKWRDNKRTNF